MRCTYCGMGPADTCRKCFDYVIAQERDVGRAGGEKAAEARIVAWLKCRAKMWRDEWAEEKAAAVVECELAAIERGEHLAKD